MAHQFGGTRSCVNSRASLALTSVLLFSIVVLLSGTRLGAQITNGINGTVTDSSGAVIVGASVTATNNLTSVATHTVTSSQGTFNLVGLIPGQYTVEVVDQGFNKSVETDVTVEISKMSALSIQLTPGRTSSTVQVVANEISLNTTSPVIGTTLEPELVQEAPLEINGLARQIDTFVLLTPGATSNSADFSVGGPAGISINGGVVYNSTVQFNGVPVAFVQFSGNQTAINPPYEMVSEFRVNSSTFDSRYGLGKGVVTYGMASGTNQLHGDAFEILRNQLFDSDGFFPTNFSPSGKPIPPVDQQNNYGFSVGGPVILPKLYHGKNRTFFHFSLDLFRQNLADTGIGTVPTPAMKGEGVCDCGDFSNFVDSTGRVIPIYDPETGEPFPLNQIPMERFSTLSKSLLSLIPDPDRPGIVSGLQSNKSPAIRSVPIDQHLWGYTIDENLSSSQSIHFSQWRDLRSSPYFTSAPIVPPTNELQSEASNTTLGSGFLLTYSKTVTPKLVATAGADWIGMIQGQKDAFTSSTFAGVPFSNIFPVVIFDGLNAPSAWGVQSQSYLANLSGGLTVNNNRTLGIALVNNWLWNKGRNSINFGGEFRRTYQDVVACGFCAGTFSFSQRTTSTPDSSDPDFGIDGSSFASFLLGDVDAGTIGFTAEQKMRTKAFAGYFQDDIKINHRLTANLGVRWDVMVPFTDESNEIVYLNPTEPDPGAGGLPGAATQFGSCTGCSGVTRAAIHWKHYQPRIGFSYALNSKTVIQSGFYITMLDGGAYEYGTATVANFMSSLLNGEFLRTATGSDVAAYGEWDTNPMPKPQPTPINPSLANGGIIFSFFPKQAGMAPYDQQWNAGVQRELPWNMFVTVSYVGSRTVHLSTTDELPNQPNPSVLQYGSLLGESITSPDAVAAGFTPPYPEFVAQFGGSATVEQALSPFPQLAGYYPTYELDGTSFYNAFQAQVSKHFSSGLSYLANMTLSTNLTNTDTSSTQFAFNGMNAYNPKPEYSPSNGNQKYDTNFVVTYELPFGLGQRYLNSRGLLGQVLGGWQLGGILTYDGGNPMSINNNYNPLLVNGFDRPNIVPGVKMKTYSYSLTKDYLVGKTAIPPVQFTTNAFKNTTTAWELGDAKRSYAALTTPPLREENIDAMKIFHITEQVRAILRVDYFNVFNRTQFGEPDTNSLDPTFGQVTGLYSQLQNRHGQATFRVEF